MTRHLVLTAIGDDRPGLVEQLAALVSAHQGSWLDSSMAHLGGKFAGIVNIAVPDEHHDALLSALRDFRSLRIHAEDSPQTAAPPAGHALHLTLVGHDRIGIVREVSQVLARHGLNVEALRTWTDSAPMSAELLFHADAELQAPAGLDAHALQAELERLSNELMVDIALGDGAT
jgi:glycine cleavage system regulatory protein